MDVVDLLDALGYRESPNFLKQGEGSLETVADYGHIFRRALPAPCHLRGVYVLQPFNTRPTDPVVPVVYVCEAHSEDDADEIHRLVWNQDVVPFLIVHTPRSLRLYSGFRHKRAAKGPAKGVLRVLSDFNRIADLIEGFHAEVIDSGKVWNRWGHEVRPEERVDWKLLKNLRTLDRWLQRHCGLQRQVSHALIGKYVFLHYLRDRDILSARKLGAWGVDGSEVFGRNATLKGVQAVIERLDDWLNGSIFPLELTGERAPEEGHLRRVAGTFAGDEPHGDDRWQLHLDFQAYDFSYIPIETLSVIYEQFLHEPPQDGSTTKGRKAGAYYTPIPVVNFMLAEMEDRRPLQRGMSVFDPSCGSGAFLVQCFRRLIEKEFPPNGERRPTPVELRELLTKHIFGVDSDRDACSVTELSLTLTLLDYVEPPDLEDDGRRRRFKLPLLRNQNVFHADFFTGDSSWSKSVGAKKFHWIVGNPPWKQLKSDQVSADDQPVWNWMAEHRADRPVGRNQMAQAFAWKVLDRIAADGEIGLLLPAMTLFEDPSRAFRAAFLQQARVHAVANFSNLAEVLFAGRSRVPAAAFFFAARPEDQETTFGEVIETYSPLVANQEPTRPLGMGKRNETWSLVVNASEIRDVPQEKVGGGNGLPWKLATWGSHFDERLLKKLAHRHDSLGDLEQEGWLIASEGLQLRRATGSRERLERVEEIAGRKRLDVNELTRLRHLFVFPKNAIKNVDTDLTYAREGRAILPLSVCRPPHVIVSAARTFAIYSEQFLVVPPRQIGIVSPTDDRAFLKALSLFLSSDFAFYHQFLTSTEFGVKRDRATLRALRQIPVPFASLAPADLSSWVGLHARLVDASKQLLRSGQYSQGSLFEARRGTGDLVTLLSELNSLVSDALGLSRRERALVHDLVQVRLELNDGKLGRAAVRSPTPKEMRTYGMRLAAELDAFLAGHSFKRHQIGIVYDDWSGMVQVELVEDATRPLKVTVVRADQATAAELQLTRRNLRRERAQWVYFDRNLRVYEGTRTFVLKPMQRFHWTESQAMCDAAEIIAETLADTGDIP